MVMVLDIHVMCVHLINIRAKVTPSEESWFLQDYYKLLTLQPYMYVYVSMYDACVHVIKLSLGTFICILRVI